MQSLLVWPNLRLAVLLGLLAVVAGLALSRIGDSHASSDHILTVSDPKAADRYLHRLPIPSGFHRVICSPASPKPAVCFKRLPSVVLSAASWVQIIDRLGVPVTKTGCNHPDYLWPGHTTAVNCLGFGHIGRERVWLNAIAIALVTGTGLRSTSRNFGSFTGTYIGVVDVGS